MGGSSRAAPARRSQGRGSARGTVRGAPAATARGDGMPGSVLQGGDGLEHALAGMIDSGALQQEVVEHLQQTAGNRAVVGVIQREDPDAGVPADAGVPVAGVPTPEAATAPGATPAVPEDLRRFREAGPYPASAEGTTILPSTGRGGFQARYDPVGMALTITLNVRVNFLDGMSLTGDRAVAAHRSLNGAANTINRLPAAERTAAVAAWQWSGGQEAWMSEFRNTAQGAWGTAGHGLQFQSSHAGWESQLARVNVVVNTQDNMIGPPEAGASTIPDAAGPTHCTANIYKTPAGNDAFGASVAPGLTTSATDQTLNLGSSQTVTHGHLLNQSVYFDPGSAVLPADQETRLQAVIRSFQTPAGGSGTSIDIVGHSDISGGRTAAGRARNQRLSEQRAQAVRTFLLATRAGGATLSNAATRIATTTGEGSAEGLSGAAGRRVDIRFAGGGSQNTAVHEFGHMIGLRDEYAVDPGGVVRGTGGTTGTATGHDTASQAAGLGRSIAENNDNIMSLGGTIRSPHMVTFMEALRSVTGSNEWRLKP